MEAALQVIEKGLGERDKLRIGLKWPLKKAVITLTATLDPTNYLKEIIKRQLNVKELEIVLGNEFSVKFDIKTTPELESEGYAREIARKIQDGRKKADLVKKDKIELFLEIDSELYKTLKSQEDFIKKRVNAVKIFWQATKDRFKNQYIFNIKDKTIKFSFNKKN